MDKEKSWETLLQSHTTHPHEEQVHEQIISTLKFLLQNISDHPLLNSFQFQKFQLPSAQDAVYDMKNLTSSLFPESFNFQFQTDDQYAYTFETLILLSTLVQCLVTFFLILVSTWILNRFTYKNPILEDLLETFIGILIFLPVIPPLAIYFGILFTIRTGIWIYLKIFCPQGEMTLLSPVDAFWAYESHASCSACVGLYIVKGKCDPEVIYKRIGETIESELVGGKMSKRITSIWGFPCWRNLDKMEIKDYVKVVLDNDDNVVGEKEIFEVMRSVQDDPIVGRAPWEVIVIPRFAYEKSVKKDEHYAVIFRIHHAIMDGISTGNILHSVMADKPFKFSLDPTEPLGHKKTSDFKTFVIYLLGFISLPRVAIRNLFLMDNHHNKYFSPGGQLTGPKTFTWSRPIKMGALKQIKNDTKTSVYSVLLTSLGGAFRQLNTKNGHVQKSDFFHAMSPIALLPYPDRKPRNRFTGVLVPAFVGGADFKPIERLQVNYQNLKKLGSTSAHFTAIANWYFPIMLGLMPLFLHKHFGCAMHLKMSLSNVPGPAEPVKIFGGGTIVDIGIWLPIKLSVGLGMGLFSNGDRVRATVIGDKASFPKECDVQFLADAFEEELMLLAQSVGLHEDQLYMSQ